MSHIKWNNDEELKLIKDISNGVSMDVIAGKHNRSVNAIQLRLEKIIYENIISGKSVETLGRLLNLSNDKIEQYNTSYKNFLSQQKKDDSHEIEQIGGANIERLNHKIDKLELENKLIRLVIENKELGGKLNKMISKGEIDKNIKKIIKKIRKS